MIIKKWISDNIKNFSLNCKTEEDLKIKVLIPILHELGYSDDEMNFENTITVVVGTKKINVRSDINVSIDGRVEMVIDSKNPTDPLTQTDLLQAESYAKLINTPPAVIALATNGIETACSNVYTGNQDINIPSKAELLRIIDKTKHESLKDVELKEVKSVLFTITNIDELYKVIKECKDIIETRGLIRSDQSFKEMTKILLVKMNEERRVKDEQLQNRFSLEYLRAHSKANDIQEIESFKILFEEAKQKYNDIYTNNDDFLQINDSACITALVEKIEPFSFLGTGDDIKGAVYEIFLKSTLRGDFDQYFTPRELVDFMIKYADPNMGDIIIDPACGSGGYLIRAFNYVNNKIHSSGLSETERASKTKELVDKCLWGGEADYDLHVLAKINLIMHGDGWNNIKQGDSLRSKEFPNDYFDLVLENPPFTIPYEFSDVLDNFDLGMGKHSEELDILFVEKSIKIVKPGHDIYIILPEGLTNISKYLYFREYLLEHCYLTLAISLPAGAFQPFGGSVSKTCILGLRKKGDISTKPKYVFVGKANEVGYEIGKKDYKPIPQNDLAEMLNASQSVFEDVRFTTNKGEYAWIKQDAITDYRIDAGFLLNQKDNLSLTMKSAKLVKLGDLCDIENLDAVIKNGIKYHYLEIPDITNETGVISNIREIESHSLKGSYYAFNGGDIIFARINPKISRVSIIPEDIPDCISSKEIYRIIYKNNPYFTNDERYCLVALLRSKKVQAQIVRLSTGSSSSRARVQPQDLLDHVYIQMPEKNDLTRLNDLVLHMHRNMWTASQQFLKAFVKSANIVGDTINIEDIRRV